MQKMKLERKVHRGQASQKTEVTEKARDPGTPMVPITDHGRGDCGAIGTMGGLGATLGHGTEVLRGANAVGVIKSVVGVAAAKTTPRDRIAPGVRVEALKTQTRSTFQDGTARPR